MLSLGVGKRWRTISENQKPVKYKFRKTAISSAGSPDRREKRPGADLGAFYFFRGRPPCPFSALRAPGAPLPRRQAVWPPPRGAPNSPLPSKLPPPTSL